MAKVYIVDDEEEMKKIEEIFIRDVHEVTCFSSGSELLNAIQVQRPDVILLDIEMPFMNGFQVLEALKGYNIPIIGVTGKNDRATILKFISAGAEGYMLKPPSKKQLLATIDDVLMKHEQKASKPNILLVDDEAESLLLYKTYLQSSFNVTALSSPLASLEYMKKFVPDMVILDYNMPVYNGKFVYEYMKNHEELANIPVVFLTGETDMSVIRSCTTLQPEAVILKSEGKDSLMQRLNKVFEEQAQKGECE